MHLALGVMKAPGARPAIGAAEYGARPARVADAAELVAEQIERLLPADGDELVAAAAMVGARPALEPAAADRRLGDARLVAEGARVRLEQRPKNLKALLERSSADGYTTFAAVRADTTVESLEIKPLD